MADDPYKPPEHYGIRKENSVPWTAYVVAIGTMICGAALGVFGFYHLLAATTLAGLFWFGIGATGVYYIITYSQRSD